MPNALSSCCPAMFAPISYYPTTPSTPPSSILLCFYGSESGSRGLLDLFTTGSLGFLGGRVITMVGKINRGQCEMGFGPWSHGSYLFIICPMGAFAYFALGCLDEEVQTTNIVNL